MIATAAKGNHVDKDRTSLRIACREDFRNLAAWIVKTSQTPPQHCLHSWAGEEPETLRAQFEKYSDDDELVYVLAYSGDSLIGAMGCEYDEGLGRGWLHGPHVLAEDWTRLASELFDSLRKKIPATVKTLDAYLNIKNTRAQEFCLQRGFAQNGGLSHEYHMRAEDMVASDSGRCSLLKKHQNDSFLRLYSELFPNTYYSGERILDMIGTSHLVFVIAESAEVLGFSIPTVDETRTRGEAQFVGVREDCRGRGYGRELLLAAVQWLVHDQHVSEVTLNVRDELTNARKLYEGVGFRLRYTGIPFRKMLSNS